MSNDLARNIAASPGTLAVVGLSSEPSRDSFTVSQYLQQHGFDIVGVNPNYREALGETCYPSLDEIPEDVREGIDAVIVFRRPDAVPQILEDCARLGLPRVWLQLGVSSPRAVELAESLGIELVHDQCIRVVHGIYERRL
jgi:predicted CoA-binding protein